MRRPIAFSIILCVVAFASSRAEKSDEVRPALLGSGPTSLVNVIDPQRLLKKGQGDGMVNFDFYVTEWGTAGSLLTFEGTPNSEGLAQALADHLEEAKFVPAVYHGAKAGAFVSGTILFAVSDGKPHLRIFLHQEPERIKRGEDFVAPQQIVPGNKTYRPFDDPDSRMEPGLVAVRIDIDATGRLVGSKLLREYPPRSTLGLKVMKNIHTATFSPGYLNGHAVACSTTWAIPFEARGGGKHWLK